jgi:hypothetical protein
VALARRGACGRGESVAWDAVWWEGGLGGLGLGVREAGRRGIGIQIGREPAAAPCPSQDDLDDGEEDDDEGEDNEF